MNKFLFTTLLLMIASNVNAQSLNVVLIGSYSVSATVDIATTQYGLGKGTVREANPIQKFFTDRGPVWSGIAKGTMHTSVGYFLTRNREKHPKLVRWSTIILTSAQIYVDIHNARTIE